MRGEGGGKPIQITGPDYVAYVISFSVVPLFVDYKN